MNKECQALFDAALDVDAAIYALGNVEVGKSDKREKDHLFDVSMALHKALWAIQHPKDQE